MLASSYKDDMGKARTIKKDVHPDFGEVS